MRTSVDLPEPDSPITTKTSPGATSNETSRTAATQPVFSRSSCRGERSRRAIRRCDRPSARRPSRRCGTKRLRSSTGSPRSLRAGAPTADSGTHAVAAAQGSGCDMGNRVAAAARPVGQNPRPWRATRYDFVIVGGGSAGSALANRLSADPANRVLVLEAGRPDYLWDVFIHMPAALTFPIGSRFYDWKYESEPEPHMNGRRIYHARGKVLGGSSSINGMIFQRGNPLDYERWARGRRAWRPGTTRTACRTSSGWSAAWPPGSRTSSAATPARSCWSAGPATSPLFGAFFEAVQQAGYPLTEDVNGYRQEGFAPFDRNIRNGPAAVGGPRVPAPGDEPAEPGRRDPGVRHEDPVRRRPRGRRRVHAPARRREARRWPARSSCAAARSTRRSCCSSPASATPTSSSALGIDVVHDLPGVGEHLQDHLEVYIQYACKQPVSVRAVHEVAVAAVDRLPVAVLPERSRRDEPLRGAAGSCAATTTSRTPT